MKGPITKREFLKRSSVALSALATAGTVSANSDIYSDQNWSQFEEKIVEEYGEEEGYKIIDIAKNEFEQASEEGWSRDTLEEEVTTEIMSSSGLNQIQSDIREFRETQADVSASSSVDETSTLSGVSTQVSTSSFSQTLDLDQSSTNKNGYANTRTAADVRDQYKILHTLVNSAVYGGGNATARMYTDFSPPSDGEYQVGVDYIRKTSMEGGGQVEISAYKETSFGGITRTTLEDVTTNVSGEVTKSGKLTVVDSSEAHNIGFEIRSSGTSSGLVTLADAYNTPPDLSNRRRAKIKEFRIRKV